MTRGIGGLIRQVAAAHVGVGIAAATMLRFGTEDPLADPEDRDSWHHLRLSYDAATSAGWAAGAAGELAWHTDNLDGYLYSPLFWAKGGPRRLKAALSLAPTLKAVHFDDLTDLQQIATMWERHRGGMLAGVMWAARAHLPLLERVAAARHVVGTALHPFQDFYSHSNWVDDPRRRGLLWTDPHLDGGDLALFTGNYEQSQIPGIAHHGRLAPECSVLQSLPGVLEVICHPASPMTKSTVCEMHRACQDGTALGWTSVYGVPVPAGLVYLAPPGIALDSRWVSPIGAQERGFAQSEGATLFVTALSLAQRQSVEFLCGLTRALVPPDLANFWSQVMLGPPSPEELRDAQFEDFHRQAVRFIGTGAYPPKPAPLAGEWYLRLRLVTADDGGAGTDADIYASTDNSGGETLLDNMPDVGPLLAYDDFEAGDDQVHHLGPFSSFPNELTLRNDADDLGDVFAALGRTFVNAVRDAVYAIGDLLLSLIGGHADHVATVHRVWAPAELSRIGDGPAPFEVMLDGGKEGVYRVRGEIRRTGRTGTSTGVPCSDWAVTLGVLDCVEESVVDRASDSDEPFLIAMLVNQAARGADSHLFGPYEDVDSGDHRPLARDFVALGVPDHHGHLTLALQLWESDDEGKPGRDNSLEEFTREFSERTAPARDGFLDTLGRALGAAWTLDRVEVTAYGYEPDGTVWCGPEQVARPGTIEGGGRWRYRLAGNTESVVWGGRGCARAPLERLDLDGTGTAEIMVSSPWGLGAMRSEGEWDLAPLAMAPNGTDLGGWMLDTGRDRYGPGGAFLLNEPDRLWVTGPGGMALLRADSGVFEVVSVAGTGSRLAEWSVPGRDLRAGPAGRFCALDVDDAVFWSEDGLVVAGLDGDVVARAVIRAGEDLGGWGFDPRVDRVGPAGDFDGDGLAELVLHGPDGLRLVSFAGGVPRLRARIDTGTDFGLGSPLDPASMRVGPAVDLRGKGRRGLLVTSLEAHGFLELDVPEDAEPFDPASPPRFPWRSRAYAGHDTAVGDWVVDVTRDRWGPVGHFHSGAEEVWLSSATSIGVLSIDGHRLRLLCPHRVGEMFDDWTPTPDTRYAVGRPVQGEEGLVLAVNDWGVVLISAREEVPRIRVRVEHGNRSGAWRIDTTRNAFQ